MLINILNPGETIILSFIKTSQFENYTLKKIKNSN